MAVLRSYVDRMLREVPGMKVLLLDSETTRVVSTVFSQSEILEQEVYLVERLDGESGEQLFHLKVSSAAECWGRWQHRSERTPFAAAATCRGPPTRTLALSCRPSASCARLARTLLAYAASCASHALESTTCVR